MGKKMNAVGEILSHQAIIEFLDYKKNAQSGMKKTGISSLASSALKGVNNAKASMGIETRGVEDGVIKVQYNPSSISFSASSKEKTASAQEGDYMVTTVSSACTINMSVELIFYEDDITKNSLMPQMELFLEMMKRNTGRRVCFSWSNIRFEGVATSVDIQYEMFDRKGNPISSKVKLTIQGKSDDNIMKKAYKKMEEERRDVEEEQTVDSGASTS